jgi:hypothetical protein
VDGQAVAGLQVHDVCDAFAPTVIGLSANLKLVVNRRVATEPVNKNVVDLCLSFDSVVEQSLSGYRGPSSASRTLSFFGSIEPGVFRSIEPPRLD